MLRVVRRDTTSARRAAPSWRTTRSSSITSSLSLSIRLTEDRRHYAARGPMVACRPVRLSARGVDDARDVRAPAPGRPCGAVAAGGGDPIARWSRQTARRSAAAPPIPAISFTALWN